MSITDAGVAILKELSQIELLSLSDTGVTAACVPDLLTMQRIQSLDVSGTALARDQSAIRRLRAGLPGLQRRGGSDDGYSGTGYGGTGYGGSMSGGVLGRRRMLYQND
jgi:hypothetical protein